MAWIGKDLLTEAHCLLEVNNHFNPTPFFQLNYELKKYITFTNVCACVKGKIYLLFLELLEVYIHFFWSCLMSFTFIKNIYTVNLSLKIFTKLMRCGVVWCGVVWCGVVWCGVVKVVRWR